MMIRINPKKNIHILVEQLIITRKLKSSGVDGGIQTLDFSLGKFTHELLVIHHEELISGFLRRLVK